MRVAVFTDADFDRSSSVTTALAALLRHAPPDVRLRIYAISDLDVDEPEYLTLRSPALPLAVAGWPLHLPRIREFERRLASDDIAAIHVSTPGPAGLTGRYLAHRTGLPLVGSFHASVASASADGWAGVVTLPVVSCSLADFDWTGGGGAAATPCLASDESVDASLGRGRGSGGGPAWTAGSGDAPGARAGPPGTPPGPAAFGGDGPSVPGGNIGARGSGPYPSGTIAIGRGGRP